MSWMALRTLTTVAAEGSGAPAANVFVVLASWTRYLEVRFGPLTVAGSPTSITFGVWRRSEGAIDKLATITILSADFAAPTPQLFDFLGEAAWIVVESFAGGSSPTVSASPQCRPGQAL